MQIPYPILTTRLRKPEITVDLLPRTRLIRKLNESVSLPFTLISAGAGYGKSILVSQWLDQVNYKYSWISCMEDMNSIKIFLAYLLKGITGTGTVKFNNTLALLEGPIEVPHKTLFHHFISELDLLKENLILVFDDFHYLRNSSIIDLIENLLKYPLPNLHICILTRRDPALNLYQYKLKHSMAEFRMKDLHFTRTEIKEYAKSQFNIILNPHEVKELKEKTEGWILGLKGALMIYQKTESNERLKQGLVAQEFKDLFFNEIIFKQDQVLQTALFIASLFERFCNPMLNSILKECYDNELPSRKIIQEFERNNFFIISLDNQNEWYRFHHQFQVVLKEYLSEHVPVSDAIKFQKAGSNWLVNNGYYEEGIERAVNTDDYSFALRQFVKLKYNLLNSDQYNRLKYLLEIFPLSWQEKYPELVITKGLLLEIQGKYNTIPSILSHFEQLAEQEKIPEAEMKEYSFLKGMIFYVSGKFHECIKSFQKCVESDNAGSEYIYTLAISHMAFAMNNLKQNDKAFQILNTYLDSLSSRKHFARARIYAAKAFLYSYNGDLNETEKLLPSLIDSSSNHKHYITLSYGLYLKVMLDYYRNNYDDCTGIFENSYEHRFRMQSSYFLRIWGIKALFHVKRNETAFLEKTLSEIDEFAFLVNDYGTDQLKKCFFTEIALQKGDIQTALETGKDNSFSFYLPTPLYFIPQFTYLKLLLRMNDPDSYNQYKQLKIKLEQSGEQIHNKIIDININLLNTLENLIAGDENKAIEYLMNALEITSSENNIMIYTDYGDEIYELFEKLPEVIREQNHEKNILQLFQEIKTNKLSHGKPAAKSEIELSGRDIKILKMVSRGHKNIEIAQSMFLSPESIKKYMYEIFQKLQVDNRIKAVLKANELGLID